MSQAIEVPRQLPDLFGKSSVMVTRSLVDGAEPVTVPADYDARQLQTAMLRKDLGRVFNLHNAAEVGIANGVQRLEKPWTPEMLAG